MVNNMCKGELSKGDNDERELRSIVEWATWLREELQRRGLSERERESVEMHLVALLNNLHNPVARGTYLYRVLRTLHALKLYDLVPSSEEVMSWLTEGS